MCVQLYGTEKMVSLPMGKGYVMVTLTSSAYTLLTLDEKYKNLNEVAYHVWKNRYL